MTAGARTTQNPFQCDVAVIGGGAAGMHAAIRAAEAGARVTLISRKSLDESSSYWAQGGLAAALVADDSPERHIEDTIAAGRGLCRTSAVEVLAAEAPSAVEWLIARGVHFDRDASGELELGLEGGHTARRIVHAGGSETGRALTERLAALIRQTDGLAVLEGASATALWSDGERCFGVCTDRGPVAASATILATGGGAALWQRTTNPWGAIGAGAVLAHVAGAELADLEFCQFHPTALVASGDHDGKLITEAIRGEGAVLLGADGRRFTDELSPRDQVSIAILDRMDADGTDHVLLDMRSIDPKRFPSVFAAVAAAGFDPTRAPVPVAPASHYLMGGVLTDLDGRTSLHGLYAIGECACTGLHGANRLASNSLSECFVFGLRAASSALAQQPAGSRPEPGDWSFEAPTSATREAVWRGAGPRRSADSLAGLSDDPYPLARLIASGAAARRESRGSHRRTDYPGRDPALEGMHLVIGSAGSIRTEHWA